MTRLHRDRMGKASVGAETNIHLRAHARDKHLIDSAAELVGANRSQFMMASALKEAKRVLVDQTTIRADAETFGKVLDWLDGEPTAAEALGMTRILGAEVPWRRG